MKIRWIYVMLVSTAVLSVSCARIGPDEIGVRTRTFGPGKGIVTQDAGPGYHRFLWPLDVWHRFPSTVQSVRFAHQTDMMRAPGESRPLELTSSDGDRVLLSAEVFFCIAEGEAYQVLQDSGEGTRFFDVVRGLSQDAGRALLGRLRTENFYDVARREEVRRELVSMLRERLVLRHIELVDFLIESIDFAPDYEALIRAKKVADQRVELEKAKAFAAEETGKVELIRTQTDIRLRAMQMTAELEMERKRTDINMQAAGIRAKAERVANERRADAAHYAGIKEAEGTRLTKGAEAEGTRLKNEALMGEGGRNLVAWETVKGLNLPELLIPSGGYPWLNPRAMALQLGGEQGTIIQEAGP